MPYDRRPHMAVLTRVDTEAAPFVPDPISDAEAAALFRAVVRLFGHWGVTDKQAAKLLDLGLSTSGRWKAGDVGRIGLDGKARRANLQGIARYRVAVGKSGVGR